MLSLLFAWLAAHLLFESTFHNGLQLLQRQALILGFGSEDAAGLAVETAPLERGRTLIFGVDNAPGLTLAVSQWRFAAVFPATWQPSLCLHLRFGEGGGIPLVEIWSGFNKSCGDRRSMVNLEGRLTRQSASRDARRPW